jgi:hypothetical protein
MGEVNRTLEAASLFGITSGLGLMISAFFVGELGFLAAPAFLMLVPSLLYGTR